MKVATVFAAVALAVSAQAAAVPSYSVNNDVKRSAEPEPVAEAKLSFKNAHCPYPGQACRKLKRAADAAAFALAEPEPVAEAKLSFKNAHCPYPGQACRKLKRSAEELADAVNAAYVAIEEANAEGPLPRAVPEDGNWGDES